MPSSSLTTPGTGSTTIPAGTISLTVGGHGPGDPGTQGTAGVAPVEDDPEIPGNQGSPGLDGIDGVGGDGGAYGRKTFTGALGGLVLYYEIGASGGLTWFNLGTNSSAAVDGAYRIGQLAELTPASGQSFDQTYNGGDSSSESGGGGGAGNAGAGGDAAGSIGGTGGTGGGGGGGNAYNNGAAIGGGGGGGLKGGYGVPGSAGGTGGRGQIDLNWTIGATSTSYSPATISVGGSAFSTVHGYATAYSPAALALTGSAFTTSFSTFTSYAPASLAVTGQDFQAVPGFVTNYSPAAIVVTGSNVAHSLAFSTSYSPAALSLTGSAFDLVSSGGGVAGSGVVLPNRSVNARALQADLGNLRFRTADTAPTRTAKLEKLRTEVTESRSKTMAFSFTDGVPTADPNEPLVRILLTDNLAIGDIVATAGDAATAPAAFRFRRNGVANGTVTFTGTEGVASGVNDYVAGQTFEIYPPDPADATLDDVSISIPVTIS